MQGLKAIARPTRLRILELLGMPDARVPQGAAPNAVPPGATATGLRRKLGISQPALSEQVQVLLGTGLIESRKVGRWVIYERDEERIRQLRQTIIEKLLPPVEGT
ncbi:MAG: metalloregulator ArsR/SmtB family transcription factor [Gemmatimonadota bacterium]|nr:metalloregulator ArsR/SmtB family transcription factor [Gemmatimonadota bacterium]